MAYVKKINGYDVKDAEAMEKTNPTGTGSFSLNRKADTTVGINSVAEGINTTASGIASHAEGESTTASGDCSHAEGRNTNASYNYSHAEGLSTIASGRASHAECRCTTASGADSHAEGYGTTANGDYSHAEGYLTKAYSLYQHTQGKFNVVDSSNQYADIVGWGDSDSDRKNISALTTWGDLHLAGDVYVGANADGTGGTKLGAGGGGNGVFVVEYGTTPFADIEAAYLANKVCVIFADNRIYYLVGWDSSAASFLSSAPNGENRAVAVTSTGMWIGVDTPVILKSNISTEISTDSTDDQVASAKAVYDYIQSLDAREVSY